MYGNTPICHMEGAEMKMARFYRHVLIAKRYPHHAAMGYGHVGKALFSALKMLGVKDVAYNQPASLPYCGEN